MREHAACLEAGRSWLNTNAPAPCPVFLGAKSFPLSSTEDQLSWEKCEFTNTRNEEKYHKDIHVWIFSTKHNSCRERSHAPSPWPSLTLCKKLSVLTQRPEHSNCLSWVTQDMVLPGLPCHGWCGSLPRVSWGWTHLNHSVHTVCWPSRFDLCPHDEQC